MIIQLYSSTRPTSASSYDHPAAFFDSPDLSFQLQSSSCILRVTRPQLPATIIQLHSSTRPTSASSYDHPAVFFDSSDFSLFNESINLRQLPATNIKLRSSTSQPSSYDHPAVFCDSTYASYLQLTSSCAHLRLNYTSYQRYHSSWRPY